MGPSSPSRRPFILLFDLLTPLLKMSVLFEPLFCSAFGEGTSPVLFFVLFPFPAPLFFFLPFLPLRLWCRHALANTFSAGQCDFPDPGCPKERFSFRSFLRT